MFNVQQRQSNRKLSYSDLLTQDDFYNTFTNDLLRAKHEVITESPFITSKRLDHLLPVFRKLICRNVRILINTKPSEKQDVDYSWQTKKRFAILLETGVEVFVTGGHHRKIAIIDREILYEGSLNILSQNDSCEIMRRMHSKQLAMQMIDFINSNKFIG